MRVFAACDLGEREFPSLFVPKGTPGTAITLIGPAMDVTFHLPNGEDLTTTVHLSEVTTEEPSKN
jgi:hypothetical protein